MAKKAQTSTEAEAKKDKWSIAIAIIDTHRLLVMLQRTDNTQTASVGVAAAMFKRASNALEECGCRRAGWRCLDCRVPHRLSSMNPQQDTQVAKAGVDILKQ